MFVVHVRQNAFKCSINNMFPYSKYLNKEILQFNPSNYKKLPFKLPKNSNYN